jgi:hypothetical protein
MTSQELLDWVRELLGRSDQHGPATDADSQTESTGLEPRTDSEWAVKAPLDEVPDVAEEESGSSQEP